MSSPIEPSGASSLRFVDLTDSPPSGKTEGFSREAPLGDGFDLPAEAPPAVFQSAPAQTLPTGAPPVKEAPPNPLTQQPPPPPPPPPSNLPQIPNPHPYGERTDGGVIIGIKGKF